MTVAAGSESADTSWVEGLFREHAETQDMIASFLGDGDLEGTPADPPAVMLDLQHEIDVGEVGTFGEAVMLQPELGQYVGLNTSIVQDLELGTGDAPGSGLDFQIQIPLAFLGEGMSDVSVDFSGPLAQMPAIWPMIRELNTIFVLLAMSMMVVKAWSWAWGAYQWTE